MSSFKGEGVNVLQLLGIGIQLVIQSMENNDNPRGKKSWQAMKFKKGRKLESLSNGRSKKTERQPLSSILRDKTAFGESRQV